MTELPHKETLYNEVIDIRTFLKKYTNQNVIFIPNPGNAGDSLNAMATIQVLDHLGIKWRLGVFNQTYKGEILLYGGGGNLIRRYNCCKTFLKRNHKHNSVVILPHTISDVNETLKMLGRNVTIFCREKVSYDYVLSVLTHKDNVYLSKDMAFYTKHDYIGSGRPSNNNGRGHGDTDVCYAFREDVEKTMIEIPKNNVDISKKYTIYGNTRSLKKIEIVSNQLLRYLSGYDVVHTNRLYVCIACHLLKRKVYFYPNNYYKNTAMYNYSLYKDENVIYVHD